jgi:hypothetical protein
VERRRGSRRNRHLGSYSRDSNRSRVQCWAMSVWGAQKDGRRRERLFDGWHRAHKVHRVRDRHRGQRKSSVFMVLRPGFAACALRAVARRAGGAALAADESRSPSKMKN